MTEHLTDEQLNSMIQIQHPEKVLAGMPRVDDSTIAAIFDIDIEKYREIRNSFTKRVQQAAAELLADPAFAARVDQLPFAPGSTVIGLGDSITDDYQSWIEILRHILIVRRPRDTIKIVNTGVSGDTTSEIISRFLDVALQKPDWIICMAGTNDVRRHGKSPSKTLVSIEETKKNLAMLRNFAKTQTTARWVWMTPTPVIEEKIASHSSMAPQQLMWLNSDLAAVSEVIRHQKDLTVDLQNVFGTPPNPDLLLPDGIHPSLAGQKVITSTLVNSLSET